MKASRVITLSAVIATASVLSQPSALATGKSAAGCSGPYTLGDFSTGVLTDVATGVPEPRTAAGIANNEFSAEAVLALFASLDHNGDHMLCYKVPSGWDEPNNPARPDYYINFVDDKTV